MSHKDSGSEAQFWGYKTKKIGGEFHSYAKKIGRIIYSKIYPDYTKMTQEGRVEGAWPSN